MIYTQANLKIIAIYVMCVADLRRIHVSVVLPNAAQLKHALGLRDHTGGPSANLKDIIQQGIREKPGFCVPDLVLGLLLTPSLGKYTSLLVPYCKL